MGTAAANSSQREGAERRRWQVITPTGQKYVGVDFAKRICGVSLIRSGESMENALRACCKGVKIGKILVDRCVAGAPRGPIRRDRGTDACADCGRGGAVWATTATAWCTIACPPTSSSGKCCCSTRSSPLDAP
eukprot:scaffold431_cov315-Prasinococcus_capsulatus_cf.AAC.12